MAMFPDLARFVGTGARRSFCFDPKTFTKMRHPIVLYSFLMEPRKSSIEEAFLGAMNDHFRGVISGTQVSY